MYSRARHNSPNTHTVTAHTHATRARPRVRVRPAGPGRSGAGSAREQRRPTRSVTADRPASSGPVAVCRVTRVTLCRVRGPCVCRLLSRQVTLGRGEPERRADTDHCAVCAVECQGSSVISEAVAAVHVCEYFIHLRRLIHHAKRKSHYAITIYMCRETRVVRDRAVRVHK